MRYKCKVRGAHITAPFSPLTTMLGITLLLMASILGSVAHASDSVTHASDRHCSVRYSDETTNTSPTGATFIAVGPFTINCRGSISASLDVRTGGIGNTQLQIEKQIDGTWSVIEHGHHVNHQAEPGTYRLSVVQRSRPGSFASWKLRYSKPLP